MTTTEPARRARPRPRRGTTGKLGRTAQQYAGLGWPVFPLRPGDKVPLPGSHGCHDATTDEATINRWWERHPEANIGAATGHVFDVLDIDGGGEAEAVIDALWVGSAGPWPADRKVLASIWDDGRVQLYGVATGGCRTALMPGAHWVGIGGWVVIPPSAGGSGPLCAWANSPGCAPLVEWPEPVIALFRKGCK